MKNYCELLIIFLLAINKTIAQSNDEPMVIIATKRNNGKVDIEVTDNENRIPHKVLDKIFQPFFTAKPTGERTGLGLSMANDIVKAHGGEIKVDMEHGRGS